MHGVNNVKLKLVVLMVINILHVSFCQENLSIRKDVLYCSIWVERPLQIQWNNFCLVFIPHTVKLFCILPILLNFRWNTFEQSCRQWQYVKKKNFSTETMWERQTCVVRDKHLLQQVTSFYVLRKTSAKCYVPAGNMKLNKQNEDWISTYNDIYIVACALFYISHAIRNKLTIKWKEY
jgi:hypothetical protein